MMRQIGNENRPMRAMTAPERGEAGETVALRENYASVTVIPPPPSALKRLQQRVDFDCRHGREGVRDGVGQDDPGALAHRSAGVDDVGHIPFAFGRFGANERFCATAREPWTDRTYREAPRRSHIADRTDAMSEQSQPSSNSIGAPQVPIWTNSQGNSGLRMGVPPFQKRDRLNRSGGGSRCLVARSSRSGRRSCEGKGPFPCSRPLPSAASSETTEVRWSRSAPSGSPGRCRRCTSRSRSPAFIVRTPRTGRPRCRSTGIGVIGKITLSLMSSRTRNARPQSRRPARRRFTTFGTDAGAPSGRRSRFRPKQ